MPADVIIDPTNGQIYWNDGTGTPQSISIKGDALNAISFVGYSGSYSPGSAPGGAQTLATFNDSSTATFVPGTNNFELGSGTLRWKFYGTTGEFSSNTISSNLLNGAVLVNGGIAISGNASIGQSLNFYNPTATFYTGFKAGAVSSNTLYTLPLAFPGSGTSILQSDTSGNLIWVPMAASSSSSGGTVYAGVLNQIAFYGATGNTLGGSNTFTNNTTIGQVQILHTTASTGTSTGALQVAGGVGISGRLSFNQASFGTTGIASLPTMAMIGQTGDPIFMSILEDNSISFEGSQGQLFSISPNLTTGYIWAVNDISGVPLLRANVNGNVYISEFGGNLGIGQTNPTYKLDVKGNIGLASLNDGLYNFIISNSAASGSNSFQIRSANSIQLYNSGNTFYTAFKSAATSNVTFTLPGDAGSSGQFLQTNGSGTLTWATATGGAGSASSGVNPGGQYQIGYYASTGASIDGSSTFTNNTSTGVVSISHSTVSTNFGNGAFVVSGGVGIGGSLYVGGTGSSISGVRIASGAITSGAWNGTIISTVYGGTGLNLTGTSGVLTVSSGTVSASTTSSAISSAISDKTGSGALTFATSPDFTTSVTTGSATFAVFNTNATTINAFGAATTISLGAASGTATFNSLNNTTSASSGALVISGGVGIGRSVSVGGRLLLFNGSTYTGFVSAQVGTGNTVYTLPTTSPAIGSSVLQSTSDGVMSWVPMTATGGGSVNVAAAIANTTINIIGVNGASGSGLAVSSGTGLTYNLVNSLLTSGSYAGTWAGSTITTNYGGTGFQTYAIGDILYASTANSLGKLTVGTINQILSSNGSIPTWVSGAGLTVGFAYQVTTAQTNLATTLYPLFANASTGAIGASIDTDIVYNALSNILTVPIVYSGTAHSSPIYTSNASLAIRPGTNATTAIQLQKADGTSILNVDSTNNRIGIVQASPAYPLDVNGSVHASSGSSYLINGRVVLNETTLGNSVVNIGTITTGVWSATAITSHYGGTGLQTPLVVGDILYATTTTTWGRLAASSTSGQVLTSNGSGTLPTWQAVPASSATSVAVAPTAVNSQFSITAVSSASGTGLGLSTVASLVINPSTGIVSLSGLAVTALTQSTSSTTGALTVAGGAGIANSVFIGGMLRVGSNTFTKSYSLGDISLDNGTTDTPAFTYYWANNKNFGHDVYSSGAGSTRWRLVKEINESGGAELFSIDTTGAIQIYSGGNYSGFRFTGIGQTIYTLPSKGPESAVGTSVLASAIDGSMRWVGMSSGGSGSPGGSNKQIQYNASGSFAGASGFEYTNTGIAVTVSVYVPSGIGYTSGLWVNVIDGATTRVGIGLSNPQYELEINGEISATNKSFVIDHPTKDGMKLRYGSLEGPENGVYVRGELKGTNIIEVPEHWIGLVHPDSYTVHLTPIGRFSQLYVEKIENYNVYIADTMMCPIHCYYSVWAERKDIPKLVTEYEAQ